MKPSSIRRIRRRASASKEPGAFKKDNVQEHCFFGPAAQEPFFQPAKPVVNRKETAKEEDKVQKAADKKEEEKIQKSPEKKEDEKLQRAPEKKDEEKIQKAPEKKEEEKLQRAPEKKEEDKIQKASEKKEEEKLQRAPENKDEEKIQKAPEKKEEEKLQKKDNGDTQGGTNKTGDYIQSLNGKGQPLPEDAQDFYGERMEQDFSGVRIHTGKDASDSAKALNAKAYAYGNNIVFNEGQYNSNSQEGKTLLAHELTHVVQQGAAGNKASRKVRKKSGPQVQRGFWGDVWDGITSVGSAIVGGVKSVVGWGWDVLKSAGAWVWDLVTWLPSRVWSMLKHIGSGIVGIVSWLWSGLTGALGHIWEGVKGALGWIGAGIEGLFSWIWRGMRGTGSWAWRLINGDFSAIWDGFASAFSWIGDGVKGLLSWGWKGLEGLVIWGWKGVTGFAKWLWDGIKSGLAWYGRYLAKLLDIIGLGEIWTFIMNILKFWSTRTLTGTEEAEARKVFAGSISYWQVRIDEMSLIAKIGAFFSGSAGMGVTTAHTINFNRKISAAAGNGDMAWLIHELAHVAQYTYVGLQYMGEAIHAQATGGYNYGGGAALAGKNLSDFNREQQADIIKDYYKHVVYGSSPYAADYTRIRNQAISGNF